MSIACPMFETNVSTLDQVRAERARAKRPATRKRVEANRRNARKSTGPRTAQGKRRASRNALKHGLCATYAHLPGEEAAAFETFVNELEGEMHPRTVLQRNLFPQIANLLWRIRRLPEAESALFVRESGKAADDDETLTASEVLARRFSDDPGNGFLLMGRDERGMQNALLRMLKQFHALQKTHPTTPYADGDGYCPREGSEPAWSEKKAKAQREWFEAQAAVEKQHGVPPHVGARLVSPSAANDEGDTSVAPTGASAEAKRTQTKPPENAAGERETEKCPTSLSAPVTKRTHCDAPCEPMPRAGMNLQSSPAAPVARAGDDSTGSTEQE